jgi:hypothetical protein
VKTQAWDVDLVVPSSYHNGPIRTVRLPHATIKAPLVRVSGEKDYYRIDTVFFDVSMKRAEVMDSLINHDGYPSNILVWKAR